VGVQVKLRSLENTRHT